MPLDSVGTASISVAAGAVTDAAGNASAATQTTQAFDAQYTLGQASIDLGDFGKLIAPVQVEGKWYYHWDTNGDGVSGLTDRITHDWLDGVFLQDVSGVANPTADTTDAYRYRAINGVNLALPTAGGPSGFPFGPNGIALDGSPYYQPGTVVSSGATTNLTYDDLLAVWDAHNGCASGTFLSGIQGVPSGWAANYYCSATPYGIGNHALMNPYGGLVGAGADAASFNYVCALQVL